MLSNNTNLPLSISLWLAYDEYDYNDDTMTISATSLLKPAKELILGARVAQAPKNPSVPSEDVSRRIPSCWGTAVHNAIEAAWRSGKVKELMMELGYPERVAKLVVIDPTPKQLEDGCIPVYMERRLSRKIGPYTITGKFDFLIDGRLEDFKSTGVYTYTHKTNDTKYVQQGSIYRWLDSKLITEDDMSINYVFTDWSKLDSMRTPGYPPYKIMEQKFTLMSEQETEMFIKRKLNIIHQYWNSAEEDIPPCTAEELWSSGMVYKYYKNPQSVGKRSTKNFPNAHDANMRLIQDGSVGVVIPVQPQVKACAYCSALPICKQAKSYLDSGRLKL